MENALGKVDLSVKSKDKKEDKTEETSSVTKQQDGSIAKQTVIEQLILSVDLNTISDIQKLKKLIEEIEDNINSNGDDHDNGLAFV